MVDAAPSDSFSLVGRTALVTGSSRGLGAATARRLARAGCDVVVTYRRQEAAAREVAAAVEAAGQRAWVQRCDMGEVDDIDALLAAVADPERGPGRLDIVVANAAATSFRPLLEAEPRHLERTFAISVTGFLRLVQRSMPLLEASGHGRVVAVSGADTVTWIPAHGILAAAKAAMESMVAYLACEVGERGVSVIGVNPGWIDGDSLQLMLGPFYEAAADVERRTHPMRQTMSPDDVAESVVALCTDAARLMSGSVVAADGAGVFAFCGRFITLSAEQALAGGAGVDPAGAAPSVVRRTTPPASG
jgi:enoyl-[acyl-carrier protein] reductase III